jgi:DNA-binding response OmpR family regulator
MVARIVFVHDDPEFNERGTIALRAAGYDVASFTDPMLALDALDEARTVELLITRIILPAGKPDGLALSRMARLRRPQIHILLMATAEAKHLTRGWGEYLPLPATAEELVIAAQKHWRAPVEIQADALPSMGADMRSRAAVTRGKAVGGQ